MANARRGYLLSLRKAKNCCTLFRVASSRNLLRCRERARRARLYHSTPFASVSRRRERWRRDKPSPQRSLEMRRAWLLLGAAVYAAAEHQMCESWAESGECESNPAFMKKECAAACANAGKYKTQIQKECEGYAQMGECGRNPAFMLSTCRRECDKWEASKGGGVSIRRRSRARPRAQPTTPTLALSR